VLQGRAASGTRQPREFTSAAPLKFTRLSGVTAGQRLFRRQRLPATHLMRALRAQRSGTPMLAHRTIYSACSVRHRTSRRAQKSELQRSKPNGIGDVAVAPDMFGQRVSHPTKYSLSFTRPCFLKKKINISL
jgi:hypothetical protein